MCMPAETARLRAVKWMVVRQDTHGTRFDIEGFDTRAEAEAMVKRFESGYPHHQTYFIEKRPSRSKENCGARQGSTVQALSG